MLHYFDHDDFRSARKALMILSISIVIFSNLIIVGDQFEFSGVNVKFDQIDHDLLATAILTYFVFNFALKSVAYYSITLDRIRTEYSKDIKYSKEKLNIELVNTGNFEEREFTNEQLEEIFENVSHGLIRRAKILKLSKYVSFYVIDYGLPYLLSIIALIETYR